MDPRDAPFGSPDPFLAGGDDIDVDAEGSRSRFSCASVEDSNTIASTVVEAGVPDRKKARTEKYHAKSEQCVIVMVPSEGEHSRSEMLANAVQASSSFSPPPPLANVHSMRQRTVEEQTQPEIQTVKPTAAPAPALFTAPPDVALASLGDEKHTFAEDKWHSTSQVLAHLVEAYTEIMTRRKVANVTETATTATANPAPQEATGCSSAYQEAQEVLWCAGQYSFSFLLTDAFHTAAWYALCFAGPSLPLPVLVTLRTLLALSPTPFAPLSRSSRDMRNDRSEEVTTHATLASSPHQRERANTDEEPMHDSATLGLEMAELVLRLALRKPPSFTRAHLEAQYGDQLHIYRALKALSQTPWGAEMRPAPSQAPRQDTLPAAAPPLSASSKPNNTVNSTRSATHAARYDRHVDHAGSPQPHKTQPQPGPHSHSHTCRVRANSSTHRDGIYDDDFALRRDTLLRHYDGHRVSALLVELHGIALSYRAGTMASSKQTTRMTAVEKDTAEAAQSVIDVSEPGQELLEVLYAVRVRELRTLAFALYYHYHPTMAPPAGGPRGSPRLSTTLTAAAEETTAAVASANGHDAVHAEDEEDNADITQGERVRTTLAAAVADARSSTSARAANLTDAATGIIPSRKRDLLQYLIELRFCENRLTDNNTSASGGPPLSRLGEDEEGNDSTDTEAMSAVSRVIAAYWEVHIGHVYTVPPSLKMNVRAVVELFHALTGNFGAGGTLATMASSGSPSSASAAASLAVAVAPSLLFVRTQMLLLAAHARHRLARAVLLQSIHTASSTHPDMIASSSPLLASPRFPQKVRADKCSARDQAEAVESWLPPWWWWCPPVARDEAAGPSTPDSRTHPSVGSTVVVDTSSAESSQLVPQTRSGWSPTARLRIGRERRPLVLFPTSQVLVQYQAALYAHQELFLLTDAPASSPLKQQMRDKSVVQAWYSRALDTIAALKQEEKAFLEAMRDPSSPHDARDENSTVTVRDVVQQNGFFSHHLLQFLPIYRWFAYLELLVPVLQSCHMYTEANVCLRILTEEPILTLAPRRHMASRATHTTSRRRSSSPASPRRTSRTSASARAATAAAAALASFHFYYRPEKHGEWRQRLALNLSHLQKHEEAMHVLKRSHAQWYPLWAACGASSAGPMKPPQAITKLKRKGVKAGLKETGTLADAAVADTALKALLTYADSLAERLTAFHTTTVTSGDLTRHEATAGRGAPRLSPLLTRTGPDDVALLAQLPPEVQRRCRLLRSTFPSSHAMAAYQAVMEYLLPRYCRRADRLTQEKTLQRLHQKVHKWTPFPHEYVTFTESIQEVPILSIPGCRDAVDVQLWHAPRSAVKAGRAHSGSSAAPSGVEEYVLRVCMETWNESADTAASLSRKRSRCPSSDAERPSRVLRKHPPQRADGAETAQTGQKWGLWRGAHCEGTWLALAARALLWECYYAPMRIEASRTLPSPPPSPPLSQHHPVKPQSSPLTTQTESDPYYTWLSPFQEGPLDVLSTIQFTLARRHLIAERLAYFETCSTEDFLNYVKVRVRNDGSGAGENVPEKHLQDPLRRPSSSSVSAEQVHAPGGRGSLLEDDEKNTDDGDEDAVLLSDTSEADVNFAQFIAETSNASSSIAFLSQRKREDEQAAAEAKLTCGEASTRMNATQARAQSHATPASTQDTLDAATLTLEHGEIADHFRVDLQGFPLLDLLHAVPRTPLLRLLRHLYLEPFSEGYGVKFSGFPDLVLWRTRGDIRNGTEHVSEEVTLDDPAQAPFRLIEVKSPSDVLSTKQMTINDCLQRCGFHVEVAKIIEVHDAVNATTTTTDTENKKKGPSTAAYGRRQQPVATTSKSSGGRAVRAIQRETHSALTGSGEDQQKKDKKRQAAVTSDNVTTNFSDHSTTTSLPSSLKEKNNSHELSGTTVL